VAQVTSPEQVDAAVSGEICVVRLRGSLGLSSVHKIAELTEQVRTARCSAVLVDASLLNRVEEACVEGLRTLWATVRLSGGNVDVYGATGPVGPVFARFAA
jgi:anti-anti-sigma regulatory factor